MTRENEIARVAYELYEKGGFVDGMDEEHWFAAEQKILAGTKPVKRRRVVKKASKSGTAKKRRSTKSM